MTSETTCPYCYEWMPTVNLHLLHMENRHPLDGEKKPDTAQFRWNVETGEQYAVASSHHERGPKEQQGDLLLWGTEQDKLAGWKGGA
jgi:hypothetical protein